MTTFRRLTLRERILEWLCPARRRRRDARLKAEIRRLVFDAPAEPVRFVD